MPKVFLSETERQADRQRDRIRAVIYGRMKTDHVTTSDLAECWKISQPGAAYRIRECKVSLMDLFAIQPLLQLSDDEVVSLVLGDRRLKEKGGMHTDQSTHSA